MRSPRALIPLFSVCAAAAVVTAAATGAAIEDMQGGESPAHADVAVADQAPDAVTINAVTWNVCGDAEAGCPLGADPEALGHTIVERAGSTEVGGRKVSPDAVFLQEVCEGQVRGFRKALKGWSWKFAPLPGGPSCVKGQGRLGVAIGTDAPLTETEETRLPAPDGGRAPLALCGEVRSWATRVCVTRFTPGEDSDRKRKQAKALADLAGTGRVLVGGDLADVPGSPALDPLYGAYAECDQTGSSRTGANTLQDWRGTAVEKTDYLFITRSAAASCSVPSEPVKESRHRPLSAAVRFH